MLLSIFPIAFIDFPIWVYIFPKPFFFPTYITSVVRTSVFPLIKSPTMRLTKFPITRILILLSSQLSLSIKNSIFPFPLVYFSILPCHSADSIFFLVFKLSLITIFSNLQLNSFSMLNVILEISFINDLFISWYELPFPMTHLIFKLSLVYSSIRLHKFPFAIGHVIRPISLIVRTILKFLSSPSIPQPIFFMPLIEDIIFKSVSNHSILDLWLGQRRW